MKYVLIITMSALFMSCGDKTEESTEATAGATINIEEEAKKFCDCYNGAKDDDAKYFECDKEKTAFVEAIKDEKVKKDLNKKITQCLEY